jgi:flavin-dependent dehydrogenase
MGIYLSLNGVPSIILERRDAINNHPRAHYINTRTCELFYQLGMLENVAKDGLPDEVMPHHLLGMFGGIDVEERKRISPALPVSVAQDKVEEHLHAKLAEYSDLCTFMRGMSLVDFKVEGDNVVVRVKDKSDTVHTFNTPYMIACDGAHSPARKALGIEMIGDPELDKIINVYFHANIITGSNAQMLGMPSESKEVKGGFICMDGKLRNTLQYLYDDGDEPMKYSTEKCRISFAKPPILQTTARLKSKRSAHGPCRPSWLKSSVKVRSSWQGMQRTPSRPLAASA